MKTYKKEVWLNRKQSSSTGAVVAYDGMDKSHNGEEYRSTFLEIKDCTRCVTLHPNNSETIKQFVKKLKKLEIVVHEFIEHLEKSSNEKNNV